MSFALSPAWLTYFQVLRGGFGRGYVVGPLNDDVPEGCSHLSEQHSREYDSDSDIDEDEDENDGMYNNLPSFTPPTEVQAEMSCRASPEIELEQNPLEESPRLEAGPLEKTLPGNDVSLPSLVYTRVSKRTLGFCSPIDFPGTGSAK